MDNEPKQETLETKQETFEENEDKTSSDDDGDIPMRFSPPSRITTGNRPRKALASLAKRIASKKRPSIPKISCFEGSHEQRYKRKYIRWANEDKPESYDFEVKVYKTTYWFKEVAVEEDNSKDCQLSTGQKLYKLHTNWMYNTEVEEDENKTEVQEDENKKQKDGSTKLVKYYLIENNNLEGGWYHQTILKSNQKMVDKATFHSSFIIL
jgi:hypothetical protein